MRGLQGVDRASLGLPTEAEYVEQYCRLRRIPPMESWNFIAKCAAATAITP
jgi:hypothetical protein